MANRRVLLIDDEADIREVAQLSLEMVGRWDVTTAASGAEGVARAEVDQPDAIILDVMMPDMDGHATFRHLQANPSTRHIPVILLTAKAPAATDRLVNEVVAVLSKPFDPLRLPGQIASALGWAA
jgi:two-component system alkaline phosphatase synthesis response regulator PhoP